MLARLSRLLRRPPTKCRWPRRERPRLEELERRDTPTILFPPVAGAESATDNGGYKLSPAIYPIFWGAGWNAASPSPAALVNATAGLAVGHYLDGLGQYGSQGAAYGSDVFNGSDPNPGGFTWNDIWDVVANGITNQGLPGPFTGPYVGAGPLYVVFTLPGTSFQPGPDLSGFNSHGSIGGGTATFAWVGGGDLDSVTSTLSHEVAEAMTDPQQGSGIYVTGGWTGPHEHQICDGEAGVYDYRVNGAWVQAYWSQRDGAFIVPDGNRQTFRVSNTLTVNGDQLGASYADTVIVGRSPSGGVQVTLNGEVAQFEPGVINSIAVNTGGGTDTVLVQANAPVTPTVTSAGGNPLRFVEPDGSVLYTSSPRVLSGDVVGHHRPDLIIPVNDPAKGLIVRTLVANGDGTYREVDSYLNDDPMVFGGAVLAEDVNGDGRTDVVFAFPDVSRPGRPLNIRAALSRGDGTFTGSGNNVLGDDPMVFGGKVLAGDVNGDGKTDVLFAFSDVSRPGNPLNIRAAVSNGDGTFGGSGNDVLGNGQNSAGATLSGRILAGTIGVAGMSVQVLNPTTGFVMAAATSDGSGNYAVTSLPAGTYRVRVAALPSGWAQLSANPGDITLTSGQARSGVNFSVWHFATLTGRTLALRGSPGDDTVTIALGPTDRVTFDGTGYSIAASAINAITYDGNGGGDTASLVASGTGNVASLFPHSGQLRGSGYTAVASGVANLYVTGGATDQAYFADSAGNDTFVATPAYAYLQGAGFLEQANGFGYARADSTAGGSDSANLYDSAGDDTFVGAPAYASLQGGGHTSFAAGFKSVRATASSGNDTAYLYDSAGDDTLVGTPTYSYLAGAGYQNVATGFKAIRAFASTGTDTAYLYDSAGDDTLVATPAYAYLQGAGYLNAANGFDSVRATASTGNDTAYLYDSAGDDTFVATPTYAYLTGVGYLNVANGFKTVRSYASSGNDQAFLYDSAGNDVFYATSTYAYLQGAGFLNVANGFKRVSAYSSGGSDQAYLIGTNTSADTFVNAGSYAYLFGTGFLVLESGFASLTVNPNAKHG